MPEPPREYRLLPTTSSTNSYEVREDNHTIAWIGCVPRPVSAAPRPANVYYPYYYFRPADELTLPSNAVCRFPSPEEAFRFAVAVRQAALAETQRRPLPDPVSRYLADQARSLRDRITAAVSALRDLQHEQYALFCLARDHGVPQAVAYVNDSELGKAVDDVLGFSRAASEREPFFSESSLYPLLGKDDARSLLSRLQRLVRLVAPEKADNL